jgi:hypothetical protein
MVEMVGICQVMWFVMLESAKDRVIGVDTPGQHVPPRVRYGTACLQVANWRSYLSRLTWCKRGRGTTVSVVTRPGLP